MPLYKQALSPYWWCSYTLPNGKRVRVSTKETNKTKAQKAYARLLAENKEPTRKTITTLLDNLLTDYSTNGKSIDWCSMVVETHLRPVFGKMKIQAITLQDVLDYRRARLEKGRSNATVNREVALLRRAFNLSHHPFPPVEKLEENNVRTGFLTDEQFFNLIQHSPTHLKPIISFGYFTGCRLREILNLKWSQVDLEHSVVRLNPGETKNREGRIIPLDEQLARILKSLDPTQEYVFTYKGKRIHDIRTGWKKATEKAKLDGLLFHDLRRCAVRNFSRAGVPEAVSMAISGHKTRSIFDRYNIVSESDLHEAMTKRSAKATRMEKDTEGFIKGGLSKF